MIGGGGKLKAFKGLNGSRIQKIQGFEDNSNSKRNNTHMIHSQYLRIDFDWSLLVKYEFENTCN